MVDLPGPEEGAVEALRVNCIGGGRHDGSVGANESDADAATRAAGLHLRRMMPGHVTRLHAEGRGVLGEMPRCAPEASCRHFTTSFT
jgi:hypothetical protein